MKTYKNLTTKIYMKRCSEMVYEVDEYGDYNPACEGKEYDEYFDEYIIELHGEWSGGKGVIATGFADNFDKAKEIADWLVKEYKVKEI